MVSVLDGSPDLSRYCEEILVGVKDTIRPKQYGKELPLKDSVLFGEEMSILFTEKLDCSFPLKFDVSLTIEDFNEAGDKELKKSNNDLQVSCEGRNIGVIPDISQLGDVENFLGKAFTVEVGKIGGDSVSNVFGVNGNGLENNVLFKKSFLDLDLYQITVVIQFELVGSVPAIMRTLLHY